MILRLAAIGALMAMVGAALSELGFRGKRIFAALCITFLLCGALEAAAKMLGQIGGLADDAGIGKIGAVAMKVVGVGYVFGFVSDIAEELGERGISSAVAVAGRVEILLLVFPYFLEICRLGEGLQ